MFEGGDSNLYGYVINDPVNLIDDDGLNAKVPGFINTRNRDGFNGGGAPFSLPKPPTTPWKSPGPGWEWRGRGPVGSDRGAWYNPNTSQSWHPDFNHGPPFGAHWDYKGPDGSFRIKPGGGICK